MWKPDTTHIAIKHSFEFNFPNSTHAIMNGPGEVELP
ncbi:hypothetical protein RO3G_14201 [Rhizopus delemar RA 99-880]|uniref:Uncharacterized protein n=1 Tax=Rhizopus delemar (strain RA 99-880 / ATCC MYA-4621 / FGSC 9543 / NRRL 43880) TaxID=246409 RepID=I1CM10_RHIO9|nr:hypothetical protein RO3G_14201 [Rhizopus delemar RA 99-880]|eukprot:EIE89490.1 hypothetical protein RO3G_14201 [Rhizopus delemar RA 99-880]